MEPDAERKLAEMNARLEQRRRERDLRMTRERCRRWDPTLAFATACAVMNLVILLVGGLKDAQQALEVSALVGAMLVTPLIVMAAAVQGFLLFEREWLNIDIVPRLVTLFLAGAAVGALATLDNLEPLPALGRRAIALFAFVAGVAAVLFRRRIMERAGRPHVEDD